jgi:hypothetical protein
MGNAALSKMVHEIAVGFAGDRNLQARPGKPRGQRKDMLLASADECPVNDEQGLPGHAHRDAFH